MGALRHKGEDSSLLRCVERWEKDEAVLLDRWRKMVGELHAMPEPDFAVLAVANRELQDLAQSSLRDRATGREAR